jgi:hypothetical protein
MDIKDVVSAYIDCGNTVGFFNAEMILMKFLPKNNLDGKCHNVPKKKREQFVQALRDAEKTGKIPANNKK